MILILIYVLTTYGLSNLLVNGIGPWEILDKIRVWSMRYSPNFLGGILECMMCLPLWIGLILSIISLVLSPVPITPFTMILGHKMWLLTLVLDAAFTSGSVWFLNTIQERIEKN